MSTPDIRRFVFAEGPLLVAEIRERTTTGERTSYLVKVITTETEMSLAHPAALRSIVFQRHGLSEDGLKRLSGAIDREIAGRAA